MDAPEPPARSGRHPGYRIQTVTELTQVPGPTLRAWERRYGIPAPTRSTNGYRVYSDRDVELVQALRRLTEAGVPASRAIRALHAGTLPSVAPPPPTADERDGYTLLIDRIVDATLRFDPEALESELRRALVLGSTVDVYERVMIPVMQHLGTRWASGGLSVAHEHLATEVLGAVAQDLHRLGQPARPVGMAVLACFADELHVLPLYGIAFRLAQLRLRTLMLGARTPPEAIGMAVERLRPDVVGLSVTVPPTSARGRALVAAYAEACGTTPWVVGGGGAAGLAAAVTAAGGLVAGPGHATLQEIVARLPSALRA